MQTATATVTSNTNAQPTTAFATKRGKTQMKQSATRTDAWQTRRLRLPKYRHIAMPHTKRAVTSHKKKATLQKKSTSQRKHTIYRLRSTATFGSKTVNTSQSRSTPTKTRSTALRQTWVT